MKQIYAFENKLEYEKNEEVISRFNEHLVKYQMILEKEYGLVDYPKGIVWNSAENATTMFSSLPIPAFTNKDLIYISPDLDGWKKLFISQLEGKKLPHIKSFYETLSENHVLTIVGHELTHHSDLFLDEFGEEREESIWFEEGMCEYLPRKYLLTDHEFTEICNVEKELVDVFFSEYGKRSIDSFGSASYSESLSSIMFDYWRSFLYIKYLIEERFNHDIKQVFEEYQNWHQEGRIIPLSKYFDLERIKL